jgi:hypothetical protein
MCYIYIEIKTYLFYLHIKSCDDKNSMLPNIISLHCLEDIFKNATPIKVGILFFEMLLLFSLFSQWYWVSWEKKQKKGSNFWLDEAHCTMTSLESLESRLPLLCLAHALALVKPTASGFTLGCAVGDVCLGTPWSFELVGIQAITHSVWFLNEFVIGTHFYCRWFFFLVRFWVSEYGVFNIPTIGPTPHQRE